MSIPGTISVLLDPSHCHNLLSAPTRDEIKSYHIQELDDDPYPSHSDEMDEIKADIKLEIEEESGNTCINPNKPTDKSTLSTNHVAVAKLGDLHTFNSFLIQTNPSNGDNIHNSMTPAHFLISSPSSTNGTPVTGETHVSTNDRPHMQASVLCQYPLQTIGVQPSTIMYAKSDYKGTAIPFPTQPWSYPYVPCSSPVTPGSYIQPSPISLPPTYQVVYGIPPTQIQTGGPQLYAPQVVIQSPNASVDMNGSLRSQQQQKEKKVHIKKPLNAFMLFMKEQRAKVIQECTLKESAAINQILGKMWHSLDKQEQAKYYEMARSERANHMQLYPSWSARDNYATKSKRKRKRKEGEEFEGETKKCFVRDSAANQLPIWCTSCSKRKMSVCKSVDEEDNMCGGGDEYCQCKTQANIITETINKLLAKKEPFLSQSSPNSSPTKHHNKDYNSPSDDEYTTMTTSTSYPSIPDQEID